MANYRSKYSQVTRELTDISMDYLNKELFKKKNIKRSTINHYQLSLLNYHELHTKPINEQLTIYLNEQQTNKRINERILYYDLMEYREHLINKNYSNNTINSLITKIKAILSYFYVDVPKLPEVQLKQEYGTTYLDLPTHKELKEICLKVDLLTRSIILFMSSSGTALNETTQLKVIDFLKGCNEYLIEPIKEDNLKQSISHLKGKHNIVPLIALKRIKTNKQYYTLCSPEASYLIIENLNSRENLKLNDKLFNIGRRGIEERFKKINKDNGYGKVKYYAKFRSHTLRKFNASNLTLSSEQIDLIQGRGKTKLHETYIKTNWEQLKSDYIEALPSILIFDNWGHSYNKNRIDLKEYPLGLANEINIYYDLTQKGVLTNKQFDLVKNRLLKNIIN
ncbi:MAG: integrase [Clostridia bacterium]|nr:integrase [Clostridia bacterium]